MNIKGRLYRLIMKVAHKYHWHYAPPIYPEGDMQLWCKWCGFRQTIQTQASISLSDYLQAGLDPVAQQQVEHLIAYGQQLEAAAKEQEQ